MRKTINDLREITLLSKEEQSKVVGGMQWTGEGSKNVIVLQNADNYALWNTTGMSWEDYKRYQLHQ